MDQSVIQTSRNQSTMQSVCNDPAVGQSVNDAASSRCRQSTMQSANDAVRQPCSRSAITLQSVRQSATQSASQQSCSQSLGHSVNHSIRHSAPRSFTRSRKHHQKVARPDNATQPTITGPPNGLHARERPLSDVPRLDALRGTQKERTNHARSANHSALATSFLIASL